MLKLSIGFFSIDLITLVIVKIIKLALKCSKNCLQIHFSGSKMEHQKDPIFYITRSLTVQFDITDVIFLLIFLLIFLDISFIICVQNCLSQYLQLSISKLFYFKVKNYSF